MKTFWVEAGANPAVPKENFRTRIDMAAPVLSPPRFEQLFKRHYREFAAACRDCDQPGVAAVAVNERAGRVAGIAFAMAKADRINAFVIGRHSEVDLSLTGTGSMSLRHIAVVVEKPAHWDDISFRVLDLHSTTGFSDETGRVMRGLRCSGSAFIRCDQFAIMFFRTGDPTDWPDNADDAWDMIPERVYFDELRYFAHGSKQVELSSPQAAGERRITGITRTHGPIGLERAVPSDEGDVVARIAITGKRGHSALDIGATALDQGILIGRYRDRCSGSYLVDGSVSRVHLLIIRSGERVYAIDTGSTNGSFVRGRGVRGVIPLEPGVPVEIGLADTQVTWSPY